jgi:Protein of unknown function (DUF3592)
MSFEAQNSGIFADPFSRIWHGLLLGFGGLFLLVGLLLLSREVVFGRSAVSAQGTIVELRKTDNADGTDWAPVIEFSTAQGQKIQFTGTSTNPPPLRGEQVPVLYDPQNPDHARMNTIVQRWLFPLIFVLVGLAMSTASLVLRFRCRQTMR